MVRFFYSLFLVLLLMPGLALAGSTTEYGGAGFATEAQPIYKLPGDHRFHAGDFYKTDPYFEWQYFTVVGKDLDTGQDVSFFWCIFLAGWNKTVSRPNNIVIMAYHTPDNGDFYSAANTLTNGGTFKSKGNDPSDKNFGFSYEAGDGISNWSIDYDHETEIWVFKGASTNDNFIKFKKNDPYRVNATLKLQQPGYVPSAYFGLEAIGYTPGYRQNPETMWGLTYYILAPNLEFNGEITIGGKKRRVQGTAWYEHQWGNYDDVERSKYFWGYMRLNDGRTFTWRQYHKTPGYKDVDTGMTRFLLINPDGTLKYAFGPSFIYTPTKWWTSPLSNETYPMYGEMDTPIGKYYFSPKWPSQESPGITTGAFIEGHAYIRSGSADGPIVGEGFVEMVDGPAGSPGPKSFPNQDLRLKVGEINR